MAFLVGGANSAADAAYDIDNSLRFNDDDSAYLSWTPSTATNDDKLTFSFWAKRSTPSANHKILTRYDSADDRFYIGWANNDKIYIYQKVGGVESFNLQTNRLFRDSSAWYHIVIAFDTTQAVEANRIKLYVNGTQETSFSTSNYPDQNLDLYYQTATSVLVKIGQYDSSQYYDGYFAEMYFVDGTQYAASDFGETDEDSGIWKPKDAKDDLTFGTNGFYLEFKETGTNQDSSGIGADTSGEDNHLAVTNLAATDQCTDTPTNNFCTFNPLMTFADMVSGTDNTLLWTEGNTTVTGETSGTPYVPSVGSIGVSSGKWYYEFYTSTTDSGTKICGAMNYDFTADGDKDYNDASYAVRASNGTLYYNGSTSDPSGTGEWKDDGDILSIALNMDDSEISWAINGGSYVSAQTISGNAIASGTMHPVAWVGDDEVVTVNFGNPNWALSSGNADANGYGNFEYAPPNGFYALCTKNLAEYG